MGSFNRDDNYVPALGATSSVDGITPVDVWADPTTHAILISGAASSSSQYDIKVDEASSTITYIGEILPGGADGDTTWRIKRLNSASGLVVRWANGTSDFDKTWSDRATYTYAA